MSYSTTLTETKTFTATHAKHIAAKVATDLKRMQRFYDYPSDAKIEQFEAEVIALLKAGYLESVQYGFLKNGDYIEPTLKYTARDLGDLVASDDDPGKVRPGADVSGAKFYSFLSLNSDWFALSESQREAFENTLPFKRGSASAPGTNGYYSNDNTYSSGGKALDRSSLRSY